MRNVHYRQINIYLCTLLCCFRGCYHWDAYFAKTSGMLGMVHFRPIESKIKVLIIIINQNISSSEVITISIFSLPLIFDIFCCPGLLYSMLWYTHTHTHTHARGRTDAEGLVRTDGHGRTCTDGRTDTYTRTYVHIQIYYFNMQCLIFLNNFPRFIITS